MYRAAQAARKHGRTSIDAFYENLKYEMMEIQGQRIRVATAKTLLKLKGGAIRPEDKADVLFLRKLVQRKKD